LAFAVVLVLIVRVSLELLGFTQVNEELVSLPLAS